MSRELVVSPVALDEIKRMDDADEMGLVYCFRTVIDYIGFLSLLTDCVEWIRGVDCRT